MRVDFSEPTSLWLCRIRGYALQDGLAYKLTSLPATHPALEAKCQI